MKNIIKSILVTGLFASLTMISYAGGSSETTFILYNGSSPLNHWPGPDGLVGTGDDLISSASSPKYFSGANSLGSLSYNAFDFTGIGSNPETTRLPNPMNAVTFLQGTVNAQNSSYPITGWNVQGTEPYAGHGPYSAQITAVNSGWWEYSSGSGWIGGPFSENVNFSASLLAGGGTATNFTFSGVAFLVTDVANATATANPYVDSVLVPLGRSLGASQLFFAHGTGTVPASSGGSGGSWPQMPIEGVLVGFSTVPEPSLSHLLCLGLLGLGWLRFYRR